MVPNPPPSAGQPEFVAATDSRLCREAWCGDVSAQRAGGLVAEGIDDRCAAEPVEAVVRPKVHG